MSNLKSITELPVVESTEGVNVIVNDNGSAKQIPIKAVGVTSWNGLNDKPFYEEVKTTAVFVDRTLELTYEEPSANVFFCDFGPVESGTAYDVVINGDAYETALKEDLVRVGDYSLCVQAERLIVYAPTNVKSIVVSVYTNKTTVKQLDKKFIPEMPVGLIFGVGDHNSTQTNGYNFTVSDNYDPLYEAILAGKPIYIRDMFTSQLSIQMPISVFLTSAGMTISVTSMSRSDAGSSGTYLYFPNGSYHSSI